MPNEALLQPIVHFRSAAGTIDADGLLSVFVFLLVFANPGVWIKHCARPTVVARRKSFLIGFAMMDRIVWSPA